MEYSFVHSGLIGSMRPAVSLSDGINRLSKHLPVQGDVIVSKAEGKWTYKSKEGSVSEKFGVIAIFDGEQMTVVPSTFQEVATEKVFEAQHEFGPD